MTFLTTGQAPQGYQSVKPPRRIGGGTSASANEGGDRLNNSQPPLLIHRYFQLSFLTAYTYFFLFRFCRRARPRQARQPEFFEEVLIEF